MPTGGSLFLHPQFCLTLNLTVLQTMLRQKAQRNNNSVSNVSSRKMHEAKLSAKAESSLDTLPPSSPSFNKNIKAIAGLKDAPDLVCLSHLRWNFVFQRPQHLLSCCAQERRVFFIEEPIFGDHPEGHLVVSRQQSGVWVVVPHLPKNLSEEAVNTAQQVLLDGLLAHESRQYICWYYTPMALAFTRHWQPLAVVYDCMDELSAFKGASPALKDYEAELFRRADLVFAGGQSLYESKVHQHPNVYAFPSSVNVAHFQKARNIIQDPADQVDIPHPRLGFFGVIDERMDLELLSGIALSRPDWQLVIIGPVAKIEPVVLPRYENIHYLGAKDYQELPAYLAGWDLAMLPFARNESTRFISPTKTPEYLAAGKPVVSTSIRDVVRSYGESGMVLIADTVAEFVTAAEKAMQQDFKKASWRSRVDAFLEQNSWDRTWAEMRQLIDSAVNVKANSHDTTNAAQDM